MYCFHNLILRSRETYNALTNWLTDARMLASQNIVIILCGNKKDLDADREVTFLEASRFAQENGKWPLTYTTAFQMGKFGGNNIALNLHYWNFKIKWHSRKVKFPGVFSEVRCL